MYSLWFFAFRAQSQRIGVHTGAENSVKEFNDFIGIPSHLPK